MHKIEVLKSNDKKLSKICSEVTDFDNPEYQEMLEQMKKISIREKAYATAAPQFGILKRFILIMTAEEMVVNNAKELEAKEINYTITPYFNPRITVMKGKQYFYESCLSVDNTVGKVARPYYIEFEAHDIKGNHIHKVAEGFEAIVFCHEIDHLDGIEYTDKAEDIYYNVNTDERIAIRREFPHEIIFKDGEFDQDNIDKESRTLIYKKRHH